MKGFKILCLFPKFFEITSINLTLHVQEYDFGDGGHTSLPFGYSLCNRWAKLPISPEN